MFGVRRGGVPSHGRDARTISADGALAPVEITIPKGRNYRNPKVLVHRSIDDPCVDARTIEGIPVTSVRRTLVDLGAVVSPDRVEKCVERALFRGMTSAPALWAYLDETGRQGRRGVQSLRAVLELRGRLAPAESDLETEMIQLIRRAGLPAPLRQLDVVVASRRFRLDLAYPDLKIAIEIDGDEPHFGARRMDHDSTAGRSAPARPLVDPALHEAPHQGRRTRDRGAASERDPDAFSSSIHRRGAGKSTKKPARG